MKEICILGFFYEKTPMNFENSSLSYVEEKFKVWIICSTPIAHTRICVPWYSY